MSPTQTRYKIGWMVVAWMILAGVAADEPKSAGRGGLEKLQASWRPESVTEGGRKLTGDDLEVYRGMTLIIQEGKSTLKTAKGVVLSSCELKVDAGRDPKTFDAKEVEGSGVGRVYKGIWELEGDTLKWCFGTRDRPTGFKEKEDEDFFLLVLKRQKTR